MQDIIPGKASGNDVIGMALNGVYMFYKAAAPIKLLLLNKWLLKTVYTVYTLIT